MPQGTIARLVVVSCFVVLAGCDGGEAGPGPEAPPPGPLAPPVEFRSRDAFQARSADDPFIAARWAGRGFYLDALPPAAVGARPGMSVADVGCGNGRHAMILSQEVGPAGRVVCRDIDERVVLALRPMAPANMEVALSEAGDVRIPEATVDVILLSDILHLVLRGQVATRDRFLASLRRALKPGGELVVVYMLAGTFNDEKAGAAFLADSDRILAEAGFERGRRWRLGPELTTPLVLEFRRPPAE